MLYLVGFSFVRGLRASPELYLFYWRTSGGAHHDFITNDPQGLLRNIAERLQNKYSLEYLNTWSSIQELPKDLKLLDIIKNKFLELDYREVGDVIEISTHMPGKLIGKGGRVIKALRKHLNREIKVVPAYWFVANEKARVHADTGILELPAGQVIKHAFRVHRNPSYGFDIDSGYIAPWHVTSEKHEDLKK